MKKERLLEKLNSALIYKESGKITKSLGLIYEANLSGASIGSVCEMTVPTSATGAGFEAEVIGFRQKNTILMPYEDPIGVTTDSLVSLRKRNATVQVGEGMLGRVLDARGQLIDGLGEMKGAFEDRALYQKPTDPVKRAVIKEPLDLGIKPLNGLLTCGKGQRIGIMAGSGVGKSVLLGMMARNARADVNVIALVGERGREVREFLERDLGPEGLARSIVVVATSDQSPLLRMRGAFLAMTIAEYFRDQGKDVLFLMDSLTRFSMAQREIGLSLGEPPASRGYTPSVFSTLPRLLERAGTSPDKGSITGLFTVLVEGDDMDDPIGDAARSILDGHIVLSRKIAERNHYPAIDILQSISRVMSAISDSDHKKWAAQIREWMAIYAEAEDIINIGAYIRGSNEKIDTAVAVHDRIQSFLRQAVEESVDYAETKALMHAIVRAGEAFVMSARTAPPPPQRSYTGGVRF